MHLHSGLNLTVFNICEVWSKSFPGVQYHGIMVNKFLKEAFINTLNQKLKKYVNGTCFRVELLDY